MKTKLRPVNKEQDLYIENWIETIKQNIGNDFAIKAIINKIYEEGFEDGYCEGKSDERDSL